MLDLISDIQKILADYHCDNASGFVMSEEHITEWINQFEEADREFILQEFLHLLRGHTYVSKVKAKELLINNINELAKKLKYSNTKDFLNETVFLNVQPKAKSQEILLSLLDVELQANFGVLIAQCGIFVQKNYVYIDDILASGKTVLRDCKNWFSQNSNLDKCISGEITFSVITFCCHQWAVNRVRWSLKYTFNKDFFTNSNKFKIYYNFLIEDNTKELNPTLNFAYPLKMENSWELYLANLTEATQHEERAFRSTNRPKKEIFFSNDENRFRFESILLNKGLEIINKIQDMQKRKNHRPLGKTYPHYKTFGTGTLFFTWRNISNTCPIVFWWDNSAHNWKGLFPLNNRGI